MSEHGGDVIAEVMVKRGVTHIFTLCGGHISPILTGAKASGIKVVDVRDEVTAAFAADAYARMTGIPGVAAVTAGPGVTNTMTAVKNAQMAQSPMVIFGGATATILRGRGSLQDIDQMSLMAPLTKWCTRVTQLKALKSTVEKAFDIASSDVPGPVFVEVPVDLLYPEEIVKEWYVKESGVDNMSGVAGKAVELYLKGHLARQFHAPHVSVNLKAKSSRGFWKLAVESHATDVAQALAEAEKPVLVVGSQTLVNMDQGEAEKVADAIRYLNVPTFLGGMARGLLGQYSDVQFRHKRTAALKEADVVVVAGFPFDFRLGYGQKINRKAKLFAVNLDQEALRKNRTPTLGTLAHPGEFLKMVAAEYEGGKDLTSWFGACRAREEKRDAEIVEIGKQKQELINPVDFFLKLEAVMDDSAVLVVDGGDFVATGSYCVRPRSPLSWLDPGVFGTLGVGGGFTTGAACVRPDAEVWLLYGDGSSAYSLAEFDTYVRHGLSPIAVIGLDAEWAQIAREQTVVLGDDVATKLLRTDYHKVAEGYGGVGLLLKDPAKIEETLNEAKKISAQGKPVCINVHISKSDFREGSISI